MFKIAIVDICWKPSLFSFETCAFSISKAFLVQKNSRKVPEQRVVGQQKNFRSLQQQKKPYLLHERPRTGLCKSNAVVELTCKLFKAKTQPKRLQGDRCVAERRFLALNATNELCFACCCKFRKLFWLSETSCNGTFLEFFSTRTAYEMKIVQLSKLNKSYFLYISTMTILIIVATKTA